MTPLLKVALWAAMILACFAVWTIIFRIIGLI